jgi:hypothetical protein
LERREEKGNGSKPQGKRYKVGGSILPVEMQYSGFRIDIVPIRDKL